MREAEVGKEGGRWAMPTLQDYKTYGRLRVDAPWERDHLGRLSKRAGRPRSQQGTHVRENRAKTPR